VAPGDGTSKGRAAEAKRQRRLERKEREAAARRRAARRRRIRDVALLAIVVVGLGAGAWYLLGPDPEVAGVERLRSAGRDHVPANQASYGAPAPTSGPHPALAPSCGPTSTPLDLGLAVHALEHGAVVVWYQPELGEELREPLLEILREWDSHWILSPNPDIEDPVVATAWNRRKAFNGPGDDVLEFVDTYRGRGPERVACDA
jgi:hypothetical protein